MLGLKIAVVVFHVTVAAAVLGASFGWGRLLRRARAAGLPAFRVAVEDVGFRAQVLRLSSFLTLFSGVGLIFLSGGFGAVTKNYHAALTVMLVAVGWNLLVIAPSIKRLRALAGAETLNEADCAKSSGKVAMGTGVVHALWLCLLVLMFVAF